MHENTQQKPALRKEMVVDAPVDGDISDQHTKNIKAILGDQLHVSQTDHT